MYYSECGFDIGIKNLSYCIIKRHDDESEYTIADWELIDLRDEIPKCCGTMKNGKKCEKTAKMFNKLKNSDFYCNSHVSQYKIPIYALTELDNIENNKKIGCKKDDMRNCIYINKNKECCTNEGCVLLDGQPYCKKHLKCGISRFERDNKLVKYKQKSCMREPLYELGTKLYEALDKRPNILSSNKIVIENQPAFKNPTMKSVSIILYSYFIMHKHPCVQFISASGKLKVNAKLTENILSSFPKKKKYEITKKIAIVYSKELINRYFKHNTKWINILDKSHKKDDLCDAFLHAYYHLFGSTGLSDKKFCDDTLSYFVNEYSKKNDRKLKSKENTITLKI
mgnify:CR=1